jgi:esterase FrsA
MSFTYDITPQAMFEDRFDQFVTLGIPRAEVEEMRGAITDMWSASPGGWVREWCRLASRYLERGQPYMASLAYGCAKFPCLANEAKREALTNQVNTYLAAAGTFPVKFERRLIETPFAAGMVTTPVHLFSVTGQYEQAPVLVICAGVDTWKMDIHGICLAFAQRFGLTVLAFDHPGTGESPVALTIDADEIVLGLLKQARRIGNGRVAHLGISFGGNYSAMTGLMGAVDASIVLGGPIVEAFAKEALENLPFGMPGILGNDMGFDHQPTMAEFIGAAAKFSRRDLLRHTGNSPMLVINGEDDYFVPQADTKVFEGRPRTEVHLIPGTGHCAFSKLPDVVAIVARWLPTRLELPPSPPAQEPHDAKNPGHLAVS